MIPNDSPTSSERVNTLRAPESSTGLLEKKSSISFLERKNSVKFLRQPNARGNLDLIPIEEDKIGGVKDDLERLQSSSNVFEYFGDDVSDSLKMVASNQPYFYHKHTVNFSKAQYFEFFAYHFFTFSILGPFCNIHSLIFRKQKHLFSNLQLRGCYFPCFRQHIFWAITMYLYYLIWTKDSKMTDINTIYSVMFSFVLRSSVISGKYATFPKNQAKMVREVKLTDKEIGSESMVSGWFQQNSEIVKTEIENALKRREIDDVLFKIAFMADISIEAQEEYEKLRKLRTTYNKIEITGAKNAKKRIEYYDSKLIFEYMVNIFNRKYSPGLKKKWGHLS